MRHGSPLHQRSIRFRAQLKNVRVKSMAEISDYDLVMTIRPPVLCIGHKTPVTLITSSTIESSDVNTKLRTHTITDYDSNSLENQDETKGTVAHGYHVLQRLHWSP